MHVEPITRRFPLVARPRPACPPLTERVREVSELARTAAEKTDAAALSTAAAAHNRAALIASDCGLADLARSWCRQQLDVYLRALPLGVQVAKHALEPVINLARLSIREGDGHGAYQLLDTLHQAVTTRTTSAIDGRRVPFGEFCVSDADHRTLCQWLWAVFLAEGTRALAGGGHWTQALGHVGKHGGIGQRLLDGRQVAILARWSTGDCDSALAALDNSTASEPWEHAVAACLAVLCRRSGSYPAESSVSTMVDRYLALEPEPPLLVFRVRLGMTTFDLAGGTDYSAAAQIATQLVREVVASGDGYAAREVLTHQELRAWLGEASEQALAESARSSGLGRGALPDRLLATLLTAVKTSEAVTARNLAVTAHV
ncbi:hypothetical protein [Pseudonocardia kunmingensis]|uniref:Uncharacterized protein n=1 Tax=Pseudonocardia kunmingensis TaxID=630975 RepID=A0A543CWX7_9PSEU|nr:hypothetical protein [Pseudonocardia kunmingensis]TQM01613.1 hypothetical protein FB558_8504 [Pseudonocardia kunmingensis]